MLLAKYSNKPIILSIAMLLAPEVIFSAKAAVIIKPRKESTMQSVPPKDKHGAIEATLAFRGFIDCQKHFNSALSDPYKNLRQCTQQFLSSNLPEQKIKDYELWLFSDYSVSEAYVCPAKTERFVRAFPENKNRRFLCFDISRTRRDVGYIFYEVVSDRRAVINEIKFSNAHLN